MTNQQGAPEALTDPSPDQLRAIARTARNSSGSASDDCGPLAYVLHGWRAAAIAFRAQQTAMVEAQQPAPSAAACVICGSDEPFTGTCGSSDPRALCKQPAPSASAAVNPDPHAELRKTWQPGQRWQARSFRNGQWGPWTDAVASEPFWFPHQDYRRHPDDLAPQPSPTPQADSQHARIAELERQLVSEAAKTAAEKLRADQMTRQHADQCAMRREDQERLRQCLHGMSGPASPTSADEGGSNG